MGDDVGDGVGDGVGLAVGRSDGDGVGDGVGNSIGDLVGLPVGIAVGEAVSSAANVFSLDMAVSQAYLNIRKRLTPGGPSGPHTNTRPVATDSPATAAGQSVE